MYPIFRPPPDFFVQKKKEKFPWFKLPVKVQQKITGKLDDVSRKTFFLSSYQTIQSMPNNCIKGITLSRESCMKITWIDRKQPVTTWYDQGGETTMLDTFQLLLEKNASTLRAVNFFDASFFIEETTIKHLKNLSMAIVNFRKHDMLDCGYTSLEQLYQISDTVTVNRITLDLDQLLKFETAYLTFQKVIFSSNDINQYLKLFMKGKINKRTRSLTLHMEKYSLLDADQIIKGLELLGGQQEKETFWFALVSSTNPCQIGIVKTRQNYFSVEFLTKNAFFADESLFAKFGDVVQANLRESYVFLEFEDLSV